MNNKSRGFTLIELIIVIVTLGVLSVVAAPRFVDFSDDANDATTVATSSAFKSGVALLHAKYQIKQSTPIAIGNQSVDFNTGGWPVGSTADSAGCADLWNKVFANAEPISVATDFSSTLSPGWNAFAYNQLCGYIKSDGGEAVYQSSSPHFVYYSDTFSYSGGGYTYIGNAGDVKLYGM